MQTRRDQLQAYRYVVRRVFTAMLGANPESLEQPMRRIGAATLAGILVAVLAVAGAGVYGKFRGGSPSKWQRPGVLIIERGTGSRFIWDAAGKQLLPVLNYTSARLALRSPTFESVTVSPKSLTGAPRGAPIGIPNAPDSLPDRDHVVSAPWTVCLGHQRSPDAAAAGKPVSTLVIGPRHGGRRLGARALVVRATADGSLFAVWRGHRLATSTDALRSLGLDRQPPIPASAAWINALPAGPDLEPMALPHAGRTAAPRLAGHRVPVGTVVRSSGAGGYYVMLADGLAPVTRTQALLLLGRPGRAQSLPVQVSAAQVNAVPESATSLRAALPSTPPQLAEPPATAPVCVRTVDADGTVPASPLVSIGGSTGMPTASRPSGAHAGGATVDQVAMTPGTVALARRLQANGQPAPGAYLVTAGLRYPVPDVSVLAMLGYPTPPAHDAATVLPVPGRVLDLLAQGPALDPAETPATKGLSNR